MVYTLLVLLALTHSTLACQRDLHNRAEPTNPILVPRQNVPFPPIWTKEEEILHKSFSNIELDKWSSYYTHGDHIAGRNKSMAEETAKKWMANGVQTEILEYEVYLNYPKEQALSLKWGNGSRYEVNMFEDVLKEDETSGSTEGMPGWHGYSASGRVEAEYVYVG